MRFVSLILAALVTAGVPARAADPDAPLTWKQVGADAKYLFTRPAHLDRSGWTKVAIVLGVGASLYLVRDEIRDFAKSDTGTTEAVLSDARWMGRLSVPLAAASGFYLAGAAGDSGYRKETGVLLLESLAYASAIAGAAQVVLVTERPRDGEAVEFLNGESGHSVSADVTIAASMLAPIIDRHLRVMPDDPRSVRFWKRFGAGSLYVTVGLVAAQRVRSDAHWAPDVFFGYATGLCVGRVLVDGRRGGRQWRDDVVVSPAPGGIRITWGR